MPAMPNASYSPVRLDLENNFEFNTRTFANLQSNILRQPGQDIPLHIGGVELTVGGVHGHHVWEGVPGHGQGLCSAKKEKYI